MTNEQTEAEAARWRAIRAELVITRLDLERWVVRMPRGILHVGPVPATIDEAMDRPVSLP